MIKLRFIKTLSLIIAAGLLMCFGSSTVFAAGYAYTNRTTGTPLSGQSWDGIASSASGKYVAGVEWGGDIYTSNNYGANWTNVTTGTSLHGLDWDYITSSSSGQYLTALADNEDIYTSNNYGANWTNVTTGTSLHGLDWGAVDASWTGQYLVAAIGGSVGGVYTSNNYGATWTLSTATDGQYFETAVSSSGQYMYVGNQAGDIQISSNYGASWSDSNVGVSGWGSIATSSSGQYVVAGIGGGDLFTSSDYGHTWTNDLNAGSHDWENIQVSYTGQYMVALGDGGVFTSSDYGQTWSSITTDPSFNGLNWYNAAISASGEYIQTSIYGGAGDIYTFTNPALAPLAPSITTKNVSLTTNQSVTVDVLTGIAGYPDSTTLSILSGPSHGAAVDPPNTITYTPAANYVGNDALEYQVCSLFDSSVCSQSTLNFTVNAASPDTGFGRPSAMLSPLAVAIASTITLAIGLLILLHQRRYIRHAKTSTR